MPYHELTPEDGQRALVRYVTSRDWWMLFSGDETGDDAIQRVLKAIPDNQGGVHVLAVPTDIGPVAVVFVHKTLITLAALLALVGHPDTAGQTVTGDPVTKNNDVLLLADDANLPALMVAALNVNLVFLAARDQLPAAPHRPTLH